MALLTGQFPRALDQKQRMAIPKRLREAMGCGAGDHVVVAPGLDGSLAIYDEGAFDELASRLARISPTDQDVRAFTRIFFSSAERVELDNQGRIRIPLGLVQLAQLGKEVTLIGARDHLEVWATNRWQAYMADKQAQYDRIAEAALKESR